MKDWYFWDIHFRNIIHLHNWLHEHLCETCWMNILGTDGMVCDLPDLSFVYLQVFYNHLLKNKITDHDFVRDVAFPFHSIVLSAAQSQVLHCVYLKGMWWILLENPNTPFNRFCYTVACPETITWIVLMKLKLHVWALNIQRLN